MFCEQQLEHYAQETGMSLPENIDISLKLSPDSQQSRCICSSIEDLPYSPSDKQESNNSSPAESPFEENDVSASFRPLSFLVSYQQLSSKPNIESDQDQPGESVAMETTGTLPLRALKSLCSSISSDVLPTVSASNEVLSKETYPKVGARNSSRLVLDSMLEKSRSVRLIPQIPLTIRDVPTPVRPESPGLWRPWVHEHER